MQIAENNIGISFLAEESFETYSGAKCSVCSIPLVPCYERKIYMLTNKESYYADWVERFRKFIIHAANLQILKQWED
ncbi:MAG: hypothetical protein Q4A55_03135 [Aerococcus sp.]|nr:hypothetical protein [Aerococcus sp.]